jgi:hypothetical protein
MRPLAQLTFVVFLFVSPAVWAQEVTGRFFPEKERYLVGEPIIIDFEVVNGTDKVAEIGTGNCLWMNPRQFEVDNASPAKHIGVYTCAAQATAGSCLGSFVEIPSGGKYLERFLLEGPFQIDSPSIYHIRAKREQEIRRKGTQEVLANLKAESNFDLPLRSPEDHELEAAYQPFFNDLHSKDLIVKYFAASAVTQKPPRFAEAAILVLANDEPGPSIGGLERLATPAARAKLLEMASISSPEYLRQASIQALGEMGNSDDCDAMLNIARQSENYTRGEAYIASAQLCKEQAVPTLLRLLPAADDQLLVYIATALENTYSRNAVPPLITLLSNPDESVRRGAEQALATLTHQRSQYGIADADSARESNRDWSTWWARNGAAANIYGPDACIEPQVLY